jgi:hypothetical protein
MAKRPSTRKQGAVRPKAKPAKGLQDLEIREKAKQVKGGIVCIPIIAILIGMILPDPPKPPPKKVL